MIKAVAIDDEPPALRVIENFCLKSGLVSVEKMFNKPQEALRYVNRFPVDLLFLDINMPSLKGTDLYRALKQQTMVIFTTAYSEFAVEGFELNAVDYLLKPFTYDRFLQSVTKASDFHQYLNKQSTQRDQYLFIRADYSLIKINLADILFIEGLDDYLKIHIKDQKPVIARMTMKAMTEKLPANNFIRVHRSYIVSFRHIENVRSKIITIAGEEIPVGNSYEEQFFNSFNK
ncbi:response regulator transcription factor [Panacibacter sp. DH6]|uniref:Response regulator transcription factor n=1 Tax=Panacibacter microcysteis TaxID=2793269 RepID=A0A931E8T7_9BACT|nr:LytTR family DNA-binding domain-containing protein [Panacibacter microcysteis]MBG9375826.1 response regulator transcription factor [Panacibacter microcysteis]